jgi:hypothetical protein
MNGYNSLILPFRLNFREVVENKESVLNGLSAIQRFFDGNIWLPLGANVETLFVRGVVGATEDLCDWFEVAAYWPDFEPEVPEEIDLWYIIFFFCLFVFFFFNIYLFF